VDDLAEVMDGNPRETALRGGRRADGGAWRQAAGLRERPLRDVIERVRPSFKAELVPYTPPRSTLVPAGPETGWTTRIPSQHAWPGGRRS
jgi:hypothetical protein